MNRRPAAALAALAIVGAGIWLPTRPALVEVPAGSDAVSALRDAPPGAVVLLGEGEHMGPLVLDRVVTLRGEPGAVVVAPADAPAVVTVVADGAKVDSISISGGSSGVVVREAEGVRLESVRVVGADLHGIEVIDASARIFGAEIAGLRHPLAQGIEVRNADGRPDTVIESSAVIGGMEGIVSHVAELEIRDNIVTETTMRGITVTEMSDGVVLDNIVHDVTGAGMYCGDMSRCQFQNNVVTGVAAGDTGRSAAGWGLVVTYHAAASTEEDVLEGAAGATMASLGGRFSERSPLEPGHGIRAAIPAGMATAGALALVALLFVCARRPAVAIAHRVGATEKRGPAWLLSLGLFALGVQTFHMIEHSLQLFRVRVDGIPSRGGIVGPRVEAEWVHLAYNAAVLIGFLLVVAARKAGWTPPGRSDIGDRILLAGVAIQGYHVIEHSVKVVQHLTSGAKVNQGILGGQIDLVLLHFSINLAVYLTAIGASVAYVWGVRLRKSVGTRSLSYG